MTYNVFSGTLNPTQSHSNNNNNECIKRKQDDKNKKNVKNVIHANLLTQLCDAMPNCLSA